MRKNVDGKATMLMVAFCFVMGLQQVAIKGIVDSVSPIFQIALRSMVAALLIFILARWVFRETWLRGVALKSGLVVGFLFALEYFFMGEGLRFTSASHMAVLLYTAPVFAALGLHLFVPEEHLDRLQWMGMVLAFIGILITFLVPALVQGETLDRTWMWGDLLGLCGGASWGLTTIVIRVSKLSEAPAMQTSFYQLTFAAVFLSLMALITHQAYFIPDKMAWLSMGFQTLVVSFAAILTWFWLLRTYLAGKLGVLLFMTPLFGVLLGVLLLGDELTAAFVMGSFLVLAGALAVNASTWLKAHLRLFRRF